MTLDELEAAARQHIDFGLPFSLTCDPETIIELATKLRAAEAELDELTIQYWDLYKIIKDATKACLIEAIRGKDNAPAEARRGCSCEMERKPCSYHEGYADACDAMGVRT